MRKQSTFYVALTLCSPLLLWLVMSCARQAATLGTASPPPTVAAETAMLATLAPATPQPSTTAASVPALTPTARTPDPTALLPYFPAGAQVVGSIQAELDGDAEPEVLVLLGLNGTADGLGYDHLRLMVLELDRAPDQVVAWQSSKLMGERGEALQARDINGDGRDEVLSYQSMGAVGYALYVVAWRDGAFGLMRPKGGYFDGRGHFGDVGVRLEDIDRDGVYEILASYGPAGTNTDVYRWDGTGYTFAITLQDK